VNVDFLVDSMMEVMAFVCAWIIMQLGKYTGPHPSPGGARILQALRLGGAGK